MAKGTTTIIIALAIILSLLSFTYDSQITEKVQLTRNIYLDYLFISIGFVSNVFIIFFFLTTLFLWEEHKRRWILPLWLSGAFAVVVSYIVKVSVKRLRPFQQEPTEIFITVLYFLKDNFNTWNFSFPSFQSMFVFSAIPVLNKEFPKFKYIWFVFACLVAFSRVYFGAHYLSDVLAGAVIGYLIGLIMVYLEERYSPSLKVMKRLKISR